MKMTRHATVFGAVLGWLLLLAMPSRAEDFFFKDGDKVVMIGDSITEQYLYSSYVELWTLTRFPNARITFRNVGIGGDTSPGGNGRFKRDVLVHKPTVMTVDFGMNDGGYGGFVPERYKTYMNGLQGMADQAKEAKIRVAWITPQPIEKPQQEPALKGYNETLEKFSAGVKEIADNNQGLFIDQFHPYLQVLEKGRPNGEGKPITGGDAVHPGFPGQTVMAATILRDMHFPKLVSAVEIDAGTGKVITADNCKVTDVDAKADRVQFERQDGALPFFPAGAESILKVTPIRDELNDYRLKVTGLKDGKYSVLLGGKKVADFNADQLAKGVNLAEVALTTGPVADQVKTVVATVQAKNDYYHNRIFRGVTLANVPDWLAVDAKYVEDKRQAAVADRMAKLPEFDAAIEKALQIKPHLVEIVPVEK